MIRVGFDARWYNSSGLGTYVVNLLQNLYDLDDHDFEIVVYENADSALHIEGQGIRRQLVRSGKYSPLGQIELAWRCRADRLDVFHSPFYVIPFASSCPVVVTVHDLMPFMFPIYGLIHQETVKAGYRYALRKASRIIAISDTTHRDVVSVLHIPAQKVRRIYNGCSSSIFHAQPEPGEQAYLQQRYGITGDYALTLSAGNWRTKNISTALAAMNIAQRRSPVPFQTVIAGPEGGYLASGLAGSMKNAIVTGFVPAEDLPRLYRHASAFLTVSLYEGFGQPLAEAMACGCPCIVSKGGSLPEVAGDAAPSFDCGDAEGMAGAIVRLLADRPYRKQLREDGLKRAQLFSYRQTAVETLLVYKEVVGAASIACAHRASRERRFRLGGTAETPSQGGRRA